MKLRHRKIMDMRLPHQEWLEMQPKHTQEWLKKQSIWNDTDMIKAFAFGAFNYYNFGGIFLIFLIPYFAYRAIGLLYFKYFVRIIYNLCIISLVFWVIINIVPELGEYLKTVSKALHLDPESNESLIIYNIECTLNKST